jgi:retinol dehydrogenase 12
VGLNPQLRGVTGKYFADCNVAKTSKLARSDELAKQLWDFSEELTKSAQ